LLLSTAIANGWLNAVFTVKNWMLGASCRIRRDQLVVADCINSTASPLGIAAPSV